MVKVKSKICILTPPQNLKFCLMQNYFIKKTLHFSKISKIPFLQKSWFKVLNKHKNYIFNWMILAHKTWTVTVFAYSVTTPDDPRLPRMIREPPENTQRSLSGVGVYISLHPLHLPLSHSPTNHASKAFIPSLLSILELDSCKETPRD